MGDSSSKAEDNASLPATTQSSGQFDGTNAQAVDTPIQRDQHVTNDRRNIPDRFKSNAPDTYPLNPIKEEQVTSDDMTHSSGREAPGSAPAKSDTTELPTSEALHSQASNSLPTDSQAGASDASRPTVASAETGRAQTAHTGPENHSEGAVVDHEPGDGSRSDYGPVEAEVIPESGPSLTTT